MKRFTLALGAVVILTTSAISANAGDISRPLNLLPGYNAPTSYDWTGFYAGGIVGYGSAHASGDATVAGIPASGSESLRGAIGGAQMGYNMQFGKWVYGLETDIQFSGQKSSMSQSSFGVTYAQNDSLPWFGTFRGRVGYAFDDLLVYATTGIGYGKFKTDVALSGLVNGSASASSTHTSWVIGGGLEYAINRSNWSAKLEYLHMAKANSSYSGTIAGVPVTSQTSVSDDFVRVGLNYRF